MQEKLPSKTASLLLSQLRSGDKIAHHKGGSVGFLLAGIAVAVGPEIVDLVSWSEMFTPAFVGHVLRLGGAAALAWLGGSPLSWGNRK